LRKGPSNAIAFHHKLPKEASMPAARMPVVTMLALLVAAANASAQTVIQIDPKSTYYRTNQDPGATLPLVISLPTVNIFPGDLLRIEQQGAFDRGVLYQDDYSTTVGVFSFDSTILDASQHPRVPAAIAAIDPTTGGPPPAFISSNTYYGNLTTDIPQDFRIDPSILVQIPPYASYLIVAPNDSYFEDNSDPNGDFKVRITVVPPFLTQSPTTLNVSTGDTGRFVTTTATPVSLSFTPTFSVESSSNPNSTCGVNLSFSPNGGTGSVNTTVTASPAGCSGINTVRASDGSITSVNTTQVVVPPQVMIKTLVGEAVSQPDTDQLSLLSTARNRFGDSNFPGGTAATWQGVLIPGQFYGAADGTANGPDQELSNASQVYTGAVGDIVAGCKCLWSPTNTQWSTIQAALQSGTKTLPSNVDAPACWGNQKKQIVVKASVALNMSGDPNKANAPSFVFMRLRPNANDPAVIQIP
jgi:hypothetical protein